VRAVIAFLALGPGAGRFFEGREVDFWGTKARPAAGAAEDLWTDSAAPAPVRRLLEDPSPENARAYVDWQRRRLERLRRAVAAVEALRERAAILYFARPGCRFCALQERELAGLPVERVPEGSPLWEEYAVSVTPTMVVGGRTFRGLTPREALVRELERD
jgi:hypothetical protein